MMVVLVEGMVFTVAELRVAAVVFLFQFPRQDRCKSLPMAGVARSILRKISLRDACNNHMPHAPHEDLNAMYVRVLGGQVVCRRAFCTVSMHSILCRAIPEIPINSSVLGVQVVLIISRVIVVDTINTILPEFGYFWVYKVMQDFYHQP